MRLSGQGDSGALPTEEGEPAVDRRSVGSSVPRWVEQPGYPGTVSAGDGNLAGGDGVGSRLRATSSRWLATGLWAVISLSLLLGMVNCAQRPAGGPAPDPAASAAAPAGPPGGCAELAVASWVAGDAHPLGGGAGVDATRPGAGRQAARTWVAAVTPGGQRWAYLVAAHVQETDPDSGQWHDAGMHFFTVTLVETGAGGCQGWLPAAGPMQVPAPPVPGEVPMPYPVVLAHSGTALSVTLESFFRGLLAGGGELERYLAPGAVVPPLVPAPYGDVSVIALRARSGSPVGAGDDLPPEGTTVRLLATVATDRTPLPLVYPVTVAARGGRWEVVAIDPLVGDPAAAGVLENR
jgi:hypothetical protein